MLETRQLPLPQNYKGSSRNNEAHGTNLISFGGGGGVEPHFVCIFK